MKKTIHPQVVNIRLGISMTSKSDGQKVFDELKQKNVTHAHVGIFDMDASFRERRFSLEQLQELKDGYGFVNVLHRWDSADSVYDTQDPFVDESVGIDFSTCRPFPFEPDSVVLISDYTGPSAQKSPRELLKRQIKLAGEQGYEVQASLEFEFIVLEENAQSLREKNFEQLTPYPQDNRCWSGLTAATHADFVAGLEKFIESIDIPLYSLGLELGPGCFEATLKAQDALRAADDAAFFKLYTKAFCRQQDLTASFMAQLSEQFPGLSGHVHISLHSKETGQPLFYDTQDAHCMSENARHFVGGVVNTLPDLLALSAHSVNAYRRMVPRNWSPRTPTWGLGNYTTAVRMVTPNENQARVEFRIPAADTNPYLAIAACLGAGLYGIEHNFDPGTPVANDGRDESPEGIDALPSNLKDAAQRLHASDTARIIFGNEFIDYFYKSRMAEIDSFRPHVSAFERARYLEVM